MKKTLWAIIALLSALPFDSQAQWTTTGTNVNNSNAGYVGIGIGTTTPTFPLTVGDAVSAVQKNSTNPYFLIRGIAADAYFQSIGGDNSGWARAALSTNIHWNNTTNEWRVDGGTYSDFSSMNYENNGNIAFYTRSATGASYDLPNTGLQAYRRLNIGTDGLVNVIGTLQANNGSSKCTIGDAGGAGLNYGTSYIGFNAARNSGSWTIHGDGVNNGGGVIYSNILGDMYFSPIATTNGSVKTLTDADIKSKIALHITATGVVRAREIKVETANWPDYVLKAPYKLPSLAAVKTYIEKNQHLPEVPSATEVEENGVNLGEMVKLQTKKIEELTLYVIEKDDQLKKQDARIAALEAALAKLTAVK